MPAQDTSRDPDATGYNAQGQLKTSYYGNTNTAAQEAQLGASLAPVTAEDNTLFNQYFGPLESQYGLSQQDLTSYFQQGTVNQADSSLLGNERNYADAIENPQTWLDKLAAGVALAGTVGLATAGIGSALAAPAAAALGTVGGAAATGAAAGAAGSSLSNLLTTGGKGLGKAAGEGALIGGVTGGISSAASGLNSGISSATGLSPSESALLSKLGITTATGALKGELSGQGAGAGAEGAAESGALNSATGAVAGSIFGNSGSSPTILNSGSTINPQATQSTVPNPAMSYDFGGDTYDPTDLYGSGSDSLGSASGGGFSGLDPSQISQLGSIDPSQFQDSLASNSQSNANSDSQGLFNLLQSNPGLASQLGVSLNGGSGSLGSSGSNSLLGQLSSLLGGGSGLSSLLGLGTNAAAGALNTQAAQGAAQQYANQTQYSPYGVSTNAGTASFNGTNATSSLSPSTQANANSLNGLVQSSANSLQGGTAGAASQYYNQLQASQQDAQNKYYQNNLDSQMANGVLSSTAGQYQSQAALGNISTQNANDQVQANNFANTQQQNQLSQLTSGLNGLNSINSSQQSLLGLGGQLGASAGQTNLQAFKPLAAANGNSTFGNILSSIGTQYNNSQPTGG